MNKRALVIGGGIGGLFTGAFLAKNGYRVTILEKNRTIGGGLQCFRRKDRLFDTGMHIMGGFEPDGNLTKICRYLGILDCLKIHHINSQCMDEVHIESTGETYIIPSGRQTFINALTAYFPSEADGLSRYVDALFALTDELPLFSLKPNSSKLPIHSAEFGMPADAFIARYVTNPKLRSLLTYLNPLYGGREGHTPAYVHALINVLYIKGASRFIAGSQQLADALCSVIEKAGGEVKAGCEVARIATAQREVQYVETSDGRRHRADWYISSIHPVEMLKMMPKDSFPRSYISRLTEIPNTHSAFSLFVALKPGLMRYIDHTCYFIESLDRIWSEAQCESQGWPHGFMYMTPPSENQGDYADTLLVHCSMSYDEVRPWANTLTGNRGPAYEAWKKDRVERVIARLEQIHPGFTEKIEAVYAASPLSIRDWYHTKEGALYGYRKDSDNLLFSQLSVRTKVKNLLLTGQNINLHGMCGVPLTSILTAEALLGQNTLIHQINHLCSTDFISPH